eukprot:scpid53650/ scgid10140/ 
MHTALCTLDTAHWTLHTAQSVHTGIAQVHIKPVLPCALQHFVQAVHVQGISTRINLMHVIVQCIPYVFRWRKSRFNWRETHTLQADLKAFTICLDEAFFQAPHTIESA